MSVICITIIESGDQIVSGIPKTISIHTNIPSTIFFTIDGTDPTHLSPIYTSPIFLPYNQLVVEIKILATNGVDSSPIISETYMTDIVNSNARLAHAATNAQSGQGFPDVYPFGTAPYQPNQIYENPAESGYTVFNPELPAIASGFDGDGYGTGYTNEPYDIENYEIKYSITNAEGEKGLGIGDLPGEITIPIDSEVPDQSNQFTTSFDPRAMVIFQDYKNQDPNDPPQINKQHYSMNRDDIMDGSAMYFTAGLESPVLSGHFVRASYNPTTNEMTHYYRDSLSNRWIISTSLYVPTGKFDGNLSGVASNWGGKVLEWLPFASTICFDTYFQINLILDGHYGM